MNHPLKPHLIRWAILALGVTLATRIVPGITCRDLGTLVVVVLLLSFFNAILKPVLLLFALPFIVVTLGLGVMVINALLFLFVGTLVNGFEVHGFWSAVGGAIVVSLTNLVASSYIGPPSRPKRAIPRPVVPLDPSSAASPTPSRPRPAPAKVDDVIDI